ncbi:response regulator [Clostridium ganghwense]|uniref:Stage 0 sporulation protein A homolog n=1 Tax=Clostridium ganghwense TaxID=312089 RepID=A0ABT4CMU8_9CLOT|nr:response regulator [Clostridium ganghwense]MCY6369421.1 response regulator [Clostridium ganghwense]
MASILVVDDAIFMRKKLKSILESVGHEVVAEANNGSKAVSAYKTYKPDLITMDISMPNNDGIGALEQIINYDNKAKIIMISSVQEKNIIVDAVIKGAKGYILKPFSEEKIVETINEILEL